MRIATITNWAYGLTLLMTFGSGAAFMAAVAADQDERAAVEQRSDYLRIADDIDMVVERMTDQARLYAMRGEIAHKRGWERDRAGASAIDRMTARLAALPLSPPEASALREADRDLTQVETIERAAIAAVDRGDRTAATALLYGDRYLALDGDIERSLSRFKAAMKARTARDLSAARDHADRWDEVAQLLLGVTALLFLAVLYFILARRVARPLANMSNVVARLAERDFEADLPDDQHRDEIGDVTQALRLFRRSSIERERLEQERDEDRRSRT